MNLTLILMVLSLSTTACDDKLSLNLSTPGEKDSNLDNDSDLIIEPTEEKNTPIKEAQPEEEKTTDGNEE